MAKRSCAKRCCLPITTPIIWANSWICGARWARGPRSDSSDLREFGTAVDWCPGDGALWPILFRSRARTYDSHREAFRDRTIYEQQARILERHAWRRGVCAERALDA